MMHPMNVFVIILPQRFKKLLEKFLVFRQPFAWHQGDVANPSLQDMV